VDQRLTGLIKDADVHAACMEIDSAVVTVLLGVESHRGLLSLSVQNPSLTQAGEGGGLNQ
jgi:hypothetical protein